jgi:glycosyltransferase involved in cell wall biosynthesis
MRAEAMADAAANAVAIVLKGYPRLSETFIAHEIRALERRGLKIDLVSLRHPTENRVHPVHREIVSPVRYLPEYLHNEPLRVLRAWRATRRLAGYRNARAAWLKDLRRDFSRNRARRFGQAMVLAAELPGGVGWLHAHFLHTPASVVRYAAHLRDLPWSVSAHAKDVWTIPEWEKREKLADCRWLVTCTSVNERHLRSLATPGRVFVVYHGLDPSRFPPPRRGASRRDGADPGDPVRLLSVGRAVEKKGFAVLLAALGRLTPSLSWRWTHIGGGPLLPHLKRLARRLRLSGRIEWLGTRDQAEVLAAYRRADAFVLASRVAADGDRDGLPNVLMEAQSQALACVSTRVSAIAELIVERETGLLVDADDAEGLARALAALIADPALRDRLGAAGAIRVQRHFSFERGIDALAVRFGLASGAG